ACHRVAIPAARHRRAAPPVQAKSRASASPLVAWHSLGLMPQERKPALGSLSCRVPDGMDSRGIPAEFVRTSSNSQPVRSQNVLRNVPVWGILLAFSAVPLFAQKTGPASWQNDLTPISPADWSDQFAAHLLERAG